MPVEVSIPVRIRSEPEILRHRLDDLDTSVTLALDRALSNSAAEVVAPRGGYPDLIMEPPLFRWHGAGLAELSERERVETEDLITRRILDAVAASGIAATRETRRRAPTPLTGRTVEDFDVSRYHGLLGLYEIPSYREDGKVAAVDVTPAETPGVVQTDSGIKFVQLPPDADAIWNALQRQFDENGRAFPIEGRVGSVFKLHGRGLLAIVVFDAGAPSVIFEALITSLRRPVAVSVGDSFEIRDESVVLSPESAFRLRNVTIVSSPAVLAGVLWRHYRPIFETAIREAAGERPEHIDPNLFESRIEAAIERAKQALIGSESKDVKSYFELLIDGEVFLIRGTGTKPFAHDVDLIPLRDDVSVPFGDGEAKTDADAEARPDVSAKDDEPRPFGRRVDKEKDDGECAGIRSGLRADEHGQRWPQTDLDGDPLVCEPLHAEPPLADLPIAETLGPRLRAFAAEIGVPYCGYAGRFCLNAAAFLTAEARRAGMRAVGSTSRTQVSMDAAGTTAIAPANDEPLQRLKELARVGATLHRLGHRMVSPMIETRACDFNGTSWALRFIYAFDRDVKRLFEHVYAETCRALLLQQLRSSRMFIEQRRQLGPPFERTVRTFSEALGVFGDETARLQILKRALAYARDPYKSRLVGYGRATRTERYQTDLLRAREYVKQAVEDVSLPASAESIVVGPIGDARVSGGPGAWAVEYQGQRFDDAALDQRIATLRRVLNSVDPLFFQIDRFRLRHTQFRHNPESVRTFLHKLLDEMSEANKDVTHEASDADDGAWFAVGTTNYVRADRFDPRGLRYRLQGLHELADQQLRTEAGDLKIYTDGVNSAIHREEVMDFLKTAGLTVGMIALAVFCAPLGLVAAGAITGAAGLATTLLVDVREAQEKEELYRSLRNPETILRWSDVELAYLFAYLGLAFSAFDILPIGRGIRGALQAGRKSVGEAMEVGVRKAARTAARKTVRQAGDEMTERITRELVQQVVATVAIEATLRLAVMPLLRPVLAEYAEQVSREHGSSAAGLSVPELPAAEEKPGG